MKKERKQRREIKKTNQENFLEPKGMSCQAERNPWVLSTPMETRIRIRTWLGNVGVLGTRK